MAARLGALTPAELYAKRFNSRALGLTLFIFFTLYTLPYMVTAIKGAAITLAGVSQGGVPEWLGGLGVTAIALIYTTLGGMRATAWTNVIQGAVFLVFMIAAFFLMSDSMGGLDVAMQKVKTQNPDLLRITPHGLFAPRAWFSWGLAISLTVIAFPHMLVRLMSGKSESALRGVCRIYPVALVLLWVPAVLIGVWGAAAFPGLVGRSSDKIFAMMAVHHLPPLLASMGFLAVLAAVMSTLDAQILTLGSMLTRDVLIPFSQGKTDENKGVLHGRLFGVAVATIVYALAQLWGSSVFNIAKHAFSGYVMLAPTLFLGVRWRRFTAAGAMTSILSGNAVLALGVAKILPTFGFLPVFWGLLAAIATAIGVSLATKPSDRSLTTQAFGN